MSRTHHITMQGTIAGESPTRHRHPTRLTKHIPWDYTGGPWGGDAGQRRRKAARDRKVNGRRERRRLNREAVRAMEQPCW
jgi:hypothetical protein